MFKAPVKFSGYNSKISFKFLEASQMLIFLYSITYHLSRSMQGPVHPPGWENPSNANNGYHDTTGFPCSSSHPRHPHHQSVDAQFRGICYDQCWVEPETTIPMQHIQEFEFYNQPHKGGAFNTYPNVSHSCGPWPRHPHQSSIPALLSTHPGVTPFHHNESGFNYTPEHRGQQMDSLPHVFDPRHLPENLNAAPDRQVFPRQMYLPSFENNSTYRYTKGIINKRAQNEIEPTLAQRKMTEAPRYEFGSKLGTVTRPQEPAHLVGKEKPCQHCQSVATSFKYFSNKNLNQPRYRCSNCKKDFTYDGKKYKKLMWYSRIGSGGLGDRNHVGSGPERGETAKGEDGFGDLNDSRLKEEEPKEQVMESENQVQETNHMEFESLESLDFLVESSTKEELKIEDIDDTAFWEDMAFWDDKGGIGSLISSSLPPCNTDP